MLGSGETRAEIVLGHENDIKSFHSHDWLNEIGREKGEKQKENIAPKPSAVNGKGRKLAPLLRRKSPP